MRVRKKAGAFEVLVEKKKYYIDAPETNKGKWQSIFGNDHPIYAEFGGGKGRFIIAMARKFPEINFIMVDAVTEVVLKAVENAEMYDLPNLRMIKIDLQFALNYFSEGELDRIYLNFSDPWPKKRHYKRRLTYRDFLAMYQTILNSEGWIYFKTDNRGLFEFSLNEFAEMDLIMRKISLDLHADETVDNIMTEYEEKFSAMGHPIFRVELTFKRHS